jgi:D-alanine transaminase
VLPVIAVDGKPVGEGKVGPVAMKLRRLYIEQAKASAI